MKSLIIDDIIKKEDIKNVFKLENGLFNSDDFMKFKAILKKVYEVNNIDLSLLTDNISKLLKSINNKLELNNYFVFNLDNQNILFYR